MNDILIHVHELYQINYLLTVLFLERWDLARLIADGEQNDVVLWSYSKYLTKLFRNKIIFVRQEAFFVKYCRGGCKNCIIQSCLTGMLLRSW